MLAVQGLIQPNLHMESLLDVPYCPSWVEPTNIPSSMHCYWSGCCHYFTLSTGSPNFDWTGQYSPVAMDDRPVAVYRALFYSDSVRLRTYIIARYRTIVMDSRTEAPYFCIPSKLSMGCTTYGRIRKGIPILSVWLTRLMRTSSYGGTTFG